MGRHGENIHKRKSDGRWEGRCLYFDNELGRNKYRYVYGNTYDEVRRKKEAVMHNIKMGHEISCKKQTPATALLFSDVADEWLAEVKASKKLSTFVKYRNVYHKHIAVNVNGVYLADLTDCIVKEKIFDHLSEAGKTMSDSMKKSIYCILGQILKFASDRHSTAVPLLKRPELAGRKKPVETFSLNEQSALFDMLHKNIDRYKAAVLISLQTGMRLGEVCALKWSDVDFDHDIIKIERTVQRLAVENGKAKTALIITEPKSDFSRREIPVSKAVTEMLEKLGCSGEYVFCGDKPIEPRTLQGYFRKTLDKAEIEGRNFHALRHTFATNCIENGMDAKCLSEILGHSNVNITLNRYVHPSMATKRVHMENIGKFYSQFRGQAA